MHWVYHKGVDVHEQVLLTAVFAQTMLSCNGVTREPASAAFGGFLDHAATLSPCSGRLGVIVMRIWMYGNVFPCGVRARHGRVSPASMRARVCRPPRVFATVTAAKGCPLCHNAMMPNAASCNKRSSTLVFRFVRFAVAKDNRRVLCCASRPPRQRVSDMQAGTLPRLMYVLVLLSPAELRMDLV